MIINPKIYIISDLHFDTKRKSKIPKEKNIVSIYDLIKLNSNTTFSHSNLIYSPEEISQNIDNFIKLLTINKKESIFVLAGDFFNDLYQTLDFINLLEKEKINAFIVLGNHDYWSYTKKRSLKESIDIASKKTVHNKYARLLITGRKYKIGNLTFIGDSGFTNLKYYDRDTSSYKTSTTEDLKKFVIDTNEIEDFEAKTFIKLNEEWTNFAKKEIENKCKNESLFIITHWPMERSSECLKDSWWNTSAKFNQVQGSKNSRDEETYWLISGHTHRDTHYSNSISVQAGYQTTKWFEQLKIEDFGCLIAVDKLYELVTNTGFLNRFYHTEIVDKNTGDYEEISKKIKLQGFRRAGNTGNKKVLSAYISNPKAYLQKVSKETYKIKNHFDGVSGYSDVLSPQLYQSKLAVKEAVNILKSGYNNNPLEFYTALIVSGYAFNKSIHLLNDMRAVNMYDMIRQAMVYLTLMNNQEIDIDNIKSITSHNHKKDLFIIGNIEIKIPVIDGYRLSVKELTPMMEEFNLFLTGMNNPKITEPNQFTKNEKHQLELN